MLVLTREPDAGDCALQLLSHAIDEISDEDLYVHSSNIARVLAAIELASELSLSELQREQLVRLVNSLLTRAPAQFLHELRPACDRAVKRMRRARTPGSSPPTAWRVVLNRIFDRWSEGDCPKPFYEEQARVCLDFFERANLSTTHVWQMSEWVFAVIGIGPTAFPLLRQEFYRAAIRRNLARAGSAQRTPNRPPERFFFPNHTEVH